jgi:PAS domain S-box-containing protein
MEPTDDESAESARSPLFEATESAVSEEPVSVLAELAAGEDARHLGRWLSETEGYRSAEDAATADVCVVDVPSLRRRGTDIANRKRARRPTYLPVLLLVGRDVGRGDPVASLSADVVDERIDAPIRQSELARRLDALARIHRLSAWVTTSRERFRTLVASLPETVLLVRDDTVLYANEAAATLFAVDDASGLDGRTVGTLTTVTEGAADLEAAIEEALNREGYLELTLEANEEQFRIVEMSATTVDGDDETRVQVLIRDVTRERLDGRQLRLYRRAIDAATVGITLCDASQPDNPLVYVNDEFCRLTGRSRAELLGRNARIAQCPETSEETRRRLREAVRDTEPISVEILNARADGERWWNALEVTPITNERGEVNYFVGFQRDVTERRERQHRLERYETIVQTAVNPMFVVEDGAFQEVNEALAGLLGESRESLLGRAPGDVFDDEATATYERAVARLHDRDSETTSTRDLAMANSEGVVRNFELNVALLPHDEGSVGILHDVTEREERRQRLAMLDRVLRHNLRNKLNVVLGYVAELQANEAFEDELSHIETAARELLDMSESAREFHRTFSRDAEPHQTEVVGSLERVVTEIRERYPDANVETAFPESAAGLVVEGTFLAIEEFVDNAVVHSQSEEPTVSVRVTRRDEYVAVRIRDQAPVLPAHERVVIDGNVEQPLSHSSGITLWLSVWTVRRTGGNVEYERLEDGNCLTVLLPTP